MVDVGTKKIGERIVRQDAKAVDVDGAAREDEGEEEEDEDGKDRATAVTQNEALVKREGRVG